MADSAAVSRKARDRGRLTAVGESQRGTVMSGSVPIKPLAECDSWGVLKLENGLEILIDDEVVERLHAKSSTVEEAVCSIQSSFASEDRMVIGLRVNGRNVDSQMMQDTLAQPLLSLERLEIMTGTRAELVTEAMDQASNCLEETERACQVAAELLTQGDTAEAAKSLGECFRVWQQIHDAVAKSIEMLRLSPDEMVIRDMPLVEIINKPVATLKQIKEALEARDHVLLADILQYELVEVTQGWHDMVAKLRSEAGEMATKAS